MTYLCYLYRVISRTSAITQGFLDQPLFSIWLAADQSKEVTGELTFGGIQSRYFNGPLNQIPVNSKVLLLCLRLVHPE